MTYAILLTCGIVGMIIGFLIGLACNGDVKKLNEEINNAEEAIEWLVGENRRSAQEVHNHIRSMAIARSEIDRLSDLVATLQAKVPARGARGKFVAR